MSTHAQVKDAIEHFIDERHEEATEKLTSAKGHVPITLKKMMSYFVSNPKRAEIRENLDSFNLQLMYP